MNAGRLPLRTCWVIIPVVLLSFCVGSGFELSPPEWLHGAWQSEPTLEETEYVRWEFTADNAIYEYHDPEYDIHTTINLRTDFAEKWVRDLEEQDDYAVAYEIPIDRVRHFFTQRLDESTGEIEDPSVLEYCANAMLSGGCWELHKQ